MKLSPIIPQLHKELLFAWRNSPLIYKWCRQNDLLDYHNHENWINNLGKDKSIKMYMIVENNDFIGVCGITDIDLINQRAEFSLYIAPEFQGKKYSMPALLLLFKHAFDSYPLNVIWGETFEGNRAAKIFSSIGMHLEGIRRDFYFRDNKFIDAHLFSIKRKEFYDRHVFNGIVKHSIINTTLLPEGKAS